MTAIFATCEAGGIISFQLRRYLAWTVSQFGIRFAFGESALRLLRRSSDPENFRRAIQPEYEKSYTVRQSAIHTCECFPAGGSGEDRNKCVVIPLMIDNISPRRISLSPLRMGRGHHRAIPDAGLQIHRWRAMATSMAVVVDGRQIHHVRTT